MNDLRTIFGKHYMRVELVPYTNTQALHRALMDKEIHATCARPEHDNQDSVATEDEQQPYHTTTRVQRLYEIMRTELSSPATSLTYVNASDSEEEHK
jgi:putative multicomponent Na+:H+ antiporter subunit B